MSGDSLQGEIIEGRMEGKRERGRTKQTLLDWMMSEGYLKKKLNIEPLEVGTCKRAENSSQWRI